MTALWMLAHTHTHTQTASVTEGCPQDEGSVTGGQETAAVPVPGSVGSSSLLLVPSLLRGAQLTEAGGAHQLQPVQGPHGGTGDGRERETRQKVE